MNELANIENKILVIRGQQVMLDRDLATLYGVETKVLNQAVKRNIERFPERFMFQLTKEEQNEVGNRLRSQFVTLDNVKSQNVTSRGRGKYSKYLYNAFTEQGVAMLSSVLKSQTAINVSIKIMDAFVAMRKFMLSNVQIFHRLDSLEAYKIESSHKIDTLFSLMDKYKIENKQGIFFQGQIYDAYSQFQKFIQQAQKEIILIDNFIDLTVLDRLSDKNVNVAVTIYTRPDTIVKPLAVKKFNNQYPTLTMKYTTTMHDRFLILDNTEIYHIGASLKDLGKKCFEFTKLEDAKRMIQDILKAL